MLFFFRSKYRSPFRGKPTTWTLKDRKGKIRGYRIEAGFLTPLRAKIADALAVASTAAFMLYAANASLVLYPDDALRAVFAVAAAMLTHPVQKFLHRRALRTSVLVEVTRDAFRINGLLGWKTYDRNAPHRFAILRHDKAQVEAEEHDFASREAARKGKVLRQTRYYQDGYHVVFEYHLQRIDIADVHGLKDAKAIQARLAGCAQAMDGLSGTGGGPALDPGTAWFGGPGNIPR